MQIRLFDPRLDIQRVTELYCQCFAEPPWHERFDPTELRQSFEELVAWPEAIFLVGCQDDVVVAGAIGYATCRKRDISELVGDKDRAGFYVAELFVDSSMRKRGICARMNTMLLRLAWDFGFRRCSVRTSIDQPVIQRLFVGKLKFEIVAEEDVVSTKWIDGVEQDVPDKRIVMTGVIPDYDEAQRQLEANIGRSGCNPRWDE
jgi:hypothetical protein